MVTSFRATTEGTGGRDTLDATSAMEEGAPTSSFPMLCLDDTKDTGGCNTTCATPPSLQQGPVTSTRHYEDTASVAGSMANLSI